MVLGRKLLLALLAGLLTVAPLSAQGPTGTIAGRVVDGATQEPLSGVTVSVGQRRAVTGPDGRYTLAQVPAGQQTLRATRIGFTEAMRTVDVAAGQTASVDLSLSTAALALEGLVAIGYGEVRERDRTGSVEAVTSEDFNTGRVVSPEQLISAKVAGVQVVESNEPGGGINIRVRGGTSVNASSEPLFVVDGVPLTVGGGLSVGRNPLNFLNPNDIESVTVLKDASATAIYGSRGANGVVIVKTKSGRADTGPQVSYTGSVSTSRVAASVDVMDAQQFRAAVQEFAPSKASMLGDANTDWRAAVERDGLGQEHTVAVAGSGDAMTYRLSLGYLDQEGVVQGSATERVSAAFNYDQRLFGDRLTLTANLLGSRTEDAFTPGGVLGAATAFAPTQPITGSDFGYFEWDQTLAANNPVAELAFLSEQAVSYRSIGSLEASYRTPFLEALTATARVGYDVARAERTNFTPSFARQQVEADSATRGYFYRQDPEALNTLLETFVTYDQPLDRWDSQLDVTAGYSFEESDREYPFFEARGLSSDLLGPNGVPAANEVRSDVTIQESRLISGFARVNFSLRDRYLLTLSVRRDGSSRFGPNNQWGTFPSAALAWRVFDEPFMPRDGFVSDLKLRASWGVNGNQEIGDYLYIPIYSGSESNALYPFGNQFVPTVRPSAVDPNIKWEETTSYNLGMDYGLLDGRLTGTVDYYFKETEDLIFRVPVAAGTNLSNFVTTNIGSVENQGLELGLNALIIDGGTDGFRWDAGFNASTNRNRLTRINAFGTGDERIPVGGISGGVGNTIQVLQPGQPLNTFYVYKHRRDESGNPVYADTDNDGVIELSELYEDVNGDGQVNTDDRRPFHNPAPQWVFGHSSQMAYRNLDLSFTMRAYLGNYVYNNVASNFGNYDALEDSGAPNNLHVSVLEYGFEAPQYFSDVYVEDASFLRMDNVTLGYTVKGLRAVDRMRVFGTVQNVFTLTGYDGVDPFAGLGGIDNNIYPRSRTFSLGVDLGF